MTYRESRITTRLSARHQTAAMPRATFTSGRQPSSAEPGSNPSSSAADTSIVSLIERATSTTAPSVDPALLRAIKSSARASDGAIRDAFRLLLSLMSKPHSHVRA